MEKPHKNHQKNQPKPTDALTDSNDEILTGHWADNAAKDLIAKHPEKQTFVCASGISPSGMVHIGNFREVITVELVVRALKDRGKSVHFIYSWDDYDALRKVPANLPNQESLAEHLRKPLSDIPDPFGTAPTYALHFEKQFESEIAQLGIQPQYIYQNQAYRSCQYADGIRTALENQSKIIEILNRYRTEPLPADWSCVTVYSEATGKDETKILAYEAPSTIRYFCRGSKKELTTDFTKDGRVKLLWRVDWPMRWASEGVDFEPGGKDHSSQGGSYETGALIAREVWKKEPPHYVQYDFVLAKGMGAKLSSSSGNLITLGEALEVYEPAVIRWIFASRKPNLDFTIAFDLDVMKAYDDFDRCERFAYGMEEGEPKRVNYERRIYELSCVAPIELQVPGSKMPAQFHFRHLCNILQICEGDIGKAQTYFEDTFNHPDDSSRFKSRATRAWKWIQTYAPDAFLFRLRDAQTPTYKTKHPQAVGKVISVLENWNQPSGPQAEEALANALWEVMQSENLDAKKFFPEIYQALVGKANGPKLGSFLLIIGTKRAAEMLRTTL
jgi:lysyl-tRNA synthetase, class I